jgi:hypothetical protein
VIETIAEYLGFLCGRLKEITQRIGEGGGRGELGK